MERTSRSLGWVVRIVHKAFTTLTEPPHKRLTFYSLEFSVSLSNSGGTLFALI